MLEEAVFELPDDIQRQASMISEGCEGFHLQVDVCTIRRPGTRPS